MIKIVSFKDLVEASDKGVGSGAFTINEARERVGNDRVDDPRADKIYITKNYEDTSKGGDTAHEKQDDESNSTNDESNPESS